MFHCSWRNPARKCRQTETNLSAKVAVAGMVSLTYISSVKLRPKSYQISVPAAFCNRIPSMMVSFAARAAKAMNSLMVAPLRAFLHQVMATPFAIATPKQMFAMPLKAESRTLGPIFWAQCFCFLPSETRRTMSELFAQRMMVNKAMAPFQGNLALRPVLH
ncbi:hypothetical protein KCU87_g541, partial [Aureobasidium melanogenum]